MSNNVEFVVESTPVLSRDQGLSDVEDVVPPTTDIPSDEASEDDDFDFGFGLDEADTSVDNWDNEKTEVLTELDSGNDLSPYFVDTEGNRERLHRFPFTIGRGQDCDLVLTGRGISRSHAEVIFESGRFVIRDLESLNGIRVNGYKVSRVILENDDEVKIGDAVLTFGFAQKEQNTGGLFSGKSSKKDKRKTSPDTAAQPEKKLTPEFDYDFSRLVKPLAFALSTLVLVVGGFYGYKLYSDNNRVSTVSVPSSDQTPANNPQAAANNPQQAAPQNTTPEPVPAPAAVAEESKPKPPAPSAVVPGAIAPSVTNTDKLFVSGLPDKSFSQPPVKKAAPKKKAADFSSRSNQKARALIGATEAKYIAGQGDQHLKQMNALLAEGKLSARVKNDLQAEAKKVQALSDQFLAGKRAETSGDKLAAAKAWQSFLALESAENFKGKSLSRREAERWLSQYYADKANEEKLQGRNHEAYRLWQKSISLDNRADARVALANVDAQAKRLYRKALRLEYVNSEQARRHWHEVLNLVPSTSEYYTKSQEKLAWYDEWGP